MLSLLRSFARSKAAMVIIGLLIVGLAAYALPNVFSGGQPRGVISAGDRFIVEGDISRRIDNIIQREAQNGQRVSREDLAKNGVVNQLIEFMAIETAQRAFSDESGIRASRLAVSETVANAPIFQDPLTGEFSEEAYLREAQRLGHRSLEELESSLRDEMTSDYINGSVPPGVDIADVLGQAWALAQSEERFVTYAKIPASVANDVSEPSDDELAEYFVENRDRFEEPKRRAVSILSISAADFIDDVEITDEDVEDFYNFRIQDYSTPETRRIFQMSANERSVVQQAVDEIGLGRTPEEITASIADLTVSEDQLMRNDISDATFANILFRIPEGEVFDPVEIEGVWKSAIVMQITPGDPQPLEAVEPDIRSTLASERAEEDFEDRIEDFYDLIGGGFSLEEAGREIGAPIMHFQAVDARARTKDNALIGAFAKRPEIVPVINDLAFEGETSEILDDHVTGGVLVVRLDSIEPAHVPELSKIRSRVETDYLATKKAEAVQSLTERLIAKTEETKDLHAAAEALGLTAVTPEIAVSSRGAPEGLSQSAVMSVRSAKKDQFFSSRDRDGGATVMHLTTVETVDRETLAFMSAPGKTALQASVLSDIENALLGEIFSSAGIQLNNDKIGKYLKQMAGEE